MQYLLAFGIASTVNKNTATKDWGNNHKVFFSPACRIFAKISTWNKFAFLFLGK
jgi:hypothetical protein